MNRTRLLIGLLLGTLVPAVTAAEPYVSDFRLTAPDTSDRASGGYEQLLAVGGPAHGGTGAPPSVCPSSGMPTDADWVTWFEVWSVTGVGGYVMAQNPASYVPLVSPKPVLTNGETATFAIGAAPVKRVAMCIYPTAGNFKAADVEVTITRRGLTAGACAEVTAPPCEATDVIPDTLNELFVFSRVNEPNVEYEIAVTAPDAGSIGIHLGGRLGTYPTLALGSN